jgi:hypothetical protein
MPDIQLVAGSASGGSGAVFVFGGGFGQPGVLNVDSSQIIPRNHF